jgi:hypothetical protein
MQLPFPVYSGIPPEIVVITGYPHAIASIIVIPAGSSHIEGNKTISDKLYIYGISLYGTYPVKMILSIIGFAICFTFSS